MRARDFQKGMRVKVIQKTRNPGTLAKFLKRYPDGVGIVDGIEEDYILVNNYMFNFDDVELLSNIVVNTSGPFKIGMKVKVDRGACNCNECLKFFRTHLDGIGFITKIDDCDRSVYVDGTSFAFGAIKILEDENKNESKSTVVALKAITIRSLDEAGACKNKLREFAKIVMEQRFGYLYTEIPAAVAQHVAEYLGFPKWLEEHGFIKYDNKKVINHLKIEEYSDSFVISAALENGGHTVLFSVYKDGKGFLRHRYVSTQFERDEATTKLKELG